MNQYKHVMPKPDEHAGRNPRLYPAYCFSKSPTYNTWVKLTARDVHNLRAEPGFEAQDIYFFLNHPIRFVRLVGPVISITEFGSNLIILGLDDGSGAAVDLKITRNSSIAAATDVANDKRHGMLPTDVPNLIIQTPRPGISNLFSSAVPLCIGTVVKAKGTLCTFRGDRQVVLRRLSVIPDTGEEAKAWAELAKFRSEILLQPWLLTSKEVSDLRERQQRNFARMSLKAKKGKSRGCRKRVMEEQIREDGEKDRHLLEQHFNKGALI